jgi:hypothetical protein
MKLISKGDAVTYALLVATAVSQAADPFRKVSEGGGYAF